VGERKRTLMVLGNRYWKAGLMGLKATDPEPFTEMEMRYENAFGGEMFDKNPVGKGIDRVGGDEGQVGRPLPNIEDPRHLIDSAGQRPVPAGFGPLGRFWRLRDDKLGSYKGKWFEERWPWFPRDFDWSHYNAAPPEMQVEGYLQGDEELFFENLNANHAEYHSRLPGLRMRCFVTRQGELAKGPGQLEEVAMKLDTLWVDMEAEKLVLVWRGWTEVQSPFFEEELGHIFIDTELVTEKAHSLGHFQQAFEKRIWDEEHEEGFEEESPPADETEKDPLLTPEEEAEIAQAEEAMRAQMIAAGIDPDTPAEPSEEEKQLLDELGIKEPEVVIPLTRAMVEERLGRGESLAGEDFSGLDLAGIKMGEADLQAAILAAVPLAGADLSGAQLSGANLAGADLTGVKLVGADLSDADLSGAKLGGADLSQANLSEANFEKADLAGAILEGAQAKDAIFAEANLKGAQLSDSMLEGADFTKSCLDQAVLQRAQLKDAAMAGVSAVAVDMSAADLTGLRAAEACDFRQGIFRQVTATESIWENANLEGANFAFAEMPGSDFTSASMAQVNMYACDMKQSRFIMAQLREAKLVLVNLFEGSFERADLAKADLSGANLYAVEFLDANVGGTVFKGANLAMTKLE